MENKLSSVNFVQWKNLGQVFNCTIKEFKKAGFYNYRSDAETLFSYLLGMQRSEIYLNRNKTLSMNEIIKINEMVSKRLRHFPVQYITKQQSFMGLDFETENKVLIPRPETEILVENAIKLLELKKITQPLKIIDMGTGSGAIAVSIAHHFNYIDVYATDISKKAIKLAQKNAIKHLCNDKITFLQGNLFGVLKSCLNPESIDAIISNPPYIPKNEISQLDKEIKEYEPHLALDGGMDGLKFYRKIIKESFIYLKKDGFLVMEMGMGQGKKIKAIFAKYVSHYRDIQIIPDYSKIERVIIAHKR